VQPTLGGHPPGRSLSQTRSLHQPQRGAAEGEEGLRGDRLLGGEGRGRVADVILQALDSGSNHTIQRHPTGGHPLSC